MGNMEVKIGRKGVSAVVATVILVLIVIAIAALIWKFAFSSVQEKIEDSEKCLGAEGKLSIEMGKYTCWDDNTDNDPSGTPDDYSVRLVVESGNGDFEISGIEVIVENGGNSKKYFANTIYETEFIEMGPLETQRIFVLDVGADSFLNALPSKISIAPLVEFRGEVVACDISDFIEPVKKCDPAI